MITVVKSYFLVYWDVISCNLVERYQSFKAETDDKAAG
jgi:hypothetical protein